MVPTDNEKLLRHKEFWSRENKTPLIGKSKGDYFISKRFSAVEELLLKEQEIEPRMLDVNKFKEDYFKMYAQSESLEHDIFFTATPFTGIPWMEAILGGKVKSNGSGFIAHFGGESLKSINFEKTFNKEWLNKFLEFTEVLQKWGINKFPVGQPIMRGPTDVLGTFTGQMNLVYAFYDEPDRIIALLNEITDMFLMVMQEQQKIIKPFHGGYSLGFYDLWCPGECVWFQDDLNALLNPEIYELYVLNSHKKIAKSNQYTMFHLHPTSFYIIDHLLEIETLDAIQINKDVGSLSLEEMLPILKKVQNRKNLIIWGSFDDQELDFLKGNINPEGLYIINYGD